MKLTQVLPLFKNKLEGKFILLYGSNQSLMTFRARWIQQHLQRLYSSLKIVRNTLSAWHDGEETLSLFTPSTSNSLIIIEKSPDKELIEFLKSAPFMESNDTFIFESPSQRRGSPLLSLVESQENTVAIGCYDTSMLEIKHYIEDAFKQQSLPIDNTVLSFLCDHFLDAPSSIFLELEKILLHTSKDTPLTIPHCEELLFSSESKDNDDLLECITNMDLLELHQYSEQAFSDTQTAIMTARTLQRHFLTLLELKYHVLSGHSFQQALSKLSQKPFFKTLKIYERILPSWSSDSLQLGLKNALEFETILKSGSGLQPTLLGHKLVTLAISNHRGVQSA